MLDQRHEGEARVSEPETSIARRSMTTATAPRTDENRQHRPATAARAPVPSDEAKLAISGCTINGAASRWSQNAMSVRRVRARDRTVEAHGECEGRQPGDEKNNFM